MLQLSPGGWQVSSNGSWGRVWREEGNTNAIKTAEGIPWESGTGSSSGLPKAKIPGCRFFHAQNFGRGQGFQGQHQGRPGVMTGRGGGGGVSCGARRGRKSGTASYLHKDQRATIQHYQIQLPKHTAKIPAHQLVPFRQKSTKSQLLPQMPQIIMHRHKNPPP